MSRPSWTVTSILRRDDTPWIGSAHEFFDDEPKARAHYDALIKAGTPATLRPYFHDFDRFHMGEVYDPKNETQR